MQNSQNENPALNGLVKDQVTPNGHASQPGTKPILRRPETRLFSEELDRFIQSPDQAISRVAIVSSNVFPDIEDVFTGLLGPKRAGHQELAEV